MPFIRTIECEVGAIIRRLFRVHADEGSKLILYY